MANSGDKTTQPVGSFSHAAWQSSSNDIWANRPFGSHRDTSGSRGVEEHPPTGPSGSAQLNSQSEVMPSWSTGYLWNQPPRSSRNASNSGGVSPTRTRDSFQNNFPDGPSVSNVFPSRSSLNQNGATFPTRAAPPGSLDPSTPSFKNVQSTGESLVDERGNSGLFRSLGSSQFGLDVSNINRRSSTDPSYLNLPNRQGSLTGPAEAETPALALSGHYPEATNFFPTMQTHPRPNAARASVSKPAVTPSPDLDETFNRGFNRGFGLLDISGPGARFYGSQPIPFNPGSQPWEPASTNTRNSFASGLGQDTWDDPVTTAHHGPKRGSMEGISPGGSSHPTDLHSPRAFNGTPNPRAGPLSRPGSRGPRMLTENERPQGAQFIQQQSGFLQASYMPPHVQQFTNPCGHQFVPAQRFRSHVPVNGYDMNFVPGITIPMRPSRDQDPGKGVRSMLLEEFRANTKSTKKFELREIYNHIVEFSGDQHGSRFIQEKLQTANSDEKDQVFREIEPNALQLMKDVFGNYVIQKFFEHGDQVQKKIIAGQMKGKVAELSTQMYACRVVQKALEHVLVDQQKEIVAELEPDIMRIVKDQNGNHVVQKIIQMAPGLCIPFIMDALHNQIEALASHNYGCRVIQRILECGTDAEKKSLMVDLHACSARLITDQYGNYVMQHVVTRGGSEDKLKLIQLVTGRAYYLSKHKFASNVVEKCIESGTSAERRAIRYQLTTTQNSSDGNAQLLNLIKDQYGNYVIQKLILNLDRPDRDEFVDEVRPHLIALKKMSTGRQITALERLIANTASQSPRHNSNAGFQVPQTTPPSPSLVVDPNSAVPTPSLTMEQNSPQSSSPPSTTNASTHEDTVVDKNIVSESQLDGQKVSGVQIQDA
ncbi:armadillo-type protein [Xylariomycetidae sp. FL2044]|nr:armadillo-type protein [Xylariomycetidae sp. FL2044]